MKDDRVQFRRDLAPTPTLLIQAVILVTPTHHVLALLDLHLLDVEGDAGVQAESAVARLIAAALTVVTGTYFFII